MNNTTRLMIAAAIALSLATSRLRALSLDPR